MYEEKRNMIAAFWQRKIQAAGRGIVTALVYAKIGKVYRTTKARAQKWVNRTFENIPAFVSV